MKKVFLTLGFLLVVISNVQAADVSGADVERMHKRILECVDSEDKAQADIRLLNKVIAELQEEIRILNKTVDETIND